MIVLPAGVYDAERLEVRQINIGLWLSIADKWRMNVSLIKALALSLHFLSWPSHYAQSCKGARLHAILIRLSSTDIKLPQLLNWTRSLVLEGTSKVSNTWWAPDGHLSVRFDSIIRFNVTSLKKVFRLRAA